MIISAIKTGTRSQLYLAGLAFCVFSLPAEAAWIPTNFGSGADAEVRESAPTQNRGSSTELGSRISDAGGGDRNSAMYMKFDISALPPSAISGTALRMTYRNSNLTASRVEDTITPDPTNRTGLAILGLDPNASGANWNENAITYENAPGITADGDVGTRDFNADTQFLGSVEFPTVGRAGHLPVGDSLIFQNALLDLFVQDVVNQGFDELTLIAVTLHDGSATVPDWLNFNYLFNPKEQTTLNTDPNSPHSGADNTNGLFSPSLFVAAVPEPATLALFGLGLAGLGIAARRRKTH